jgi:hypothetical protein
MQNQLREGDARHDFGRRSLLTRREFTRHLGIAGAGLALASIPAASAMAQSRAAKLPAGWLEPPREFSLCPFWFWNDDLTEAELERQLADFQAHGVHAFVIHPRVGLPRSIGWLSERMIHFMRFAIERARARDMWVVLYDEGMYPSGSSSGQVVAKNPAFRTRGLFAVDLDDARPGSTVQGIRIGDDRSPQLAPGQNLVALVRRKANGHRIAIVDKASDARHSFIRGLHFRDPDAPRRADHREVAEDQPPGGDILNPDAVACFIELVYQRYFDEFGKHFGKTIKAIFTDEPSMQAKSPEGGARPGTTGILAHVNRLLGYDFTEHLPALWFADEPDAARYRRDYDRALQSRFEETFYRPISQWCARHGVALTGHPAAPDDIGHLRYFQIPGQDIVWRYIEPGKPTALEGYQSTNAKCASSAMIHLGRRRNSNEYCGAYGHNFTFDEMRWLTHWLIVRGCNLLVPHAFYYSVRGPRIDERPPDVGPNSAWWEQYPTFARAVQRLCWLNADSTHVCELAILGRNDHLPWRAAKVCFQHQRDFNYLEARHLWEDAKVSSGGIRLRGMTYRVLIVEDEPPPQAAVAIAKLEKAGRVIRWSPEMAEAELVNRIDHLVKPDVSFSPATRDLRVRHVRKNGADYYLLFNEGESEMEVTLQLSVKGTRRLLDPYTDGFALHAAKEPLRLPRHALRVLHVTNR